MSRPWMKYYPRDWRSDAKLRMCSLAARGLWADLLGYMHEAEPYGHLLIDGKKPNINDVAALVGRPLPEVKKAMFELANHGVFSTREDGVVYSRRMVRDHERSEEGRKNIEKRWGDNHPNGYPNMPPNTPPNRGPTGSPITQKPEARDQNPERKKDAAADAAPSDVLIRADDHEAQLFRRGKEVLGQNAGGLIAKLLKAKGSNIALARAAIETASTKENPREYIGAVANGGKSKEDLRARGYAW